MNCRKFESQLESFLTGRLPPGSMKECRAHLESCDTCRELLDLASLESAPSGPVRTEELLQAVLKKTSGQSCAHSHEWLADYVDGALAATSRKLMEQHLENCRSCRQICRIMGELKETLPGLAQIDPGDGFTLECMDSFRRLQNQRFMARGIWERLLVRPRLAMESAYVLTLLLFVLIKLFAYVPEASRVEAVYALHANAAQVTVSVADTVRNHFNQWGQSLMHSQDRWLRASSISKREFISALSLITDKTRRYSRATSNAVMKFPNTIWNGLADQFERILPKDKPTT
jgi:hypothetical protein